MKQHTFITRPSFTGHVAVTVPKYLYAVVWVQLAHDDIWLLYDTLTVSYYEARDTAEMFNSLYSDDNEGIMTRRAPGGGYYAIRSIAYDNPNTSSFLLW